MAFNRTGDKRKPVILTFKACSKCKLPISASIEDPFCQACFKAIIAEWREKHPKQDDQPGAA